jgi:hypothetical protein
MSGVLATRAASISAAPFIANRHSCHGKVHVSAYPLDIPAGGTAPRHRIVNHQNINWVCAFEDLEGDPRIVCLPDRVTKISQYSPDERANIAVIIANENAPLALPFRSQSERLFGNRFDRQIIFSPRQPELDRATFAEATGYPNCSFGLRCEPLHHRKTSPEPRPTSLVVKKSSKTRANVASLRGGPVRLWVRPSQL